MKLKEFFYCLGLKPAPREYGYEIREQTIAGQVIKYANWLHPRAYGSEVTLSEVLRLKSFLREGDIAIDIGAHTGDTTLPMALAVGQTGAVIAFEANRFVCPTLYENAKLNPHIGRIYAYNLAVTEENRNYEFSYNDPGFMNGGGVEKTRSYRRGDAFRQQVQGVRLDDFISKDFANLRQRIRYIKIDAEGSDLYILQSIEAMIRELRPLIQAEVMRRTPRDYRHQMFDLLNDCGYRVHRFERGVHSAGPMQRDEMMIGDDFDVFCVHASEAGSVKLHNIAA